MIRGVCVPSAPPFSVSLRSIYYMSKKVNHTERTDEFLPDPCPKLRERCVIFNMNATARKVLPWKTRKAKKTKNIVKRRRPRSEFNIALLMPGPCPGKSGFEWAGTARIKPFVTPQYTCARCGSQRSAVNDENKIKMCLLGLFKPGFCVRARRAGGERMEENESKRSGCVLEDGIVLMGKYAGGGRARGGNRKKVTPGTRKHGRANNTRSTGNRNRNESGRTALFSCLFFISGSAFGVQRSLMASYAVLLPNQPP